MSKVLTAAEILSCDDLPRQRVEVPEWGGAVLLRTMTGAERDAWEVTQYERAQAAKRAGQVESVAFAANLRARLVAACACDEEGALLFKPEEVEALGRKSAAALDRCFEAAQALNRITKKDVEELEGN